MFEFIQKSYIKYYFFYFGRSWSPDAKKFHSYIVFYLLIEKYAERKRKTERVELIRDIKLSPESPLPAKNIYL